MRACRRRRTCVTASSHEPCECCRGHRIRRTWRWALRVRAGVGRTNRPSRTTRCRESHGSIEWVNHMDDLDRIVRRLLQNLRGNYPQYLSTPFSTEELYQVIVPYRHNRQELGIDTNQDYEMALMRLLSGERGYLVVDRDVRESLTRELESSNPDTSLFRAFNDRSVSVSADAVALLDPATRTSDDARIAAPPPAARQQGSPPPRSPQGSRAPAISPQPASRARAGGMGTPPAPSMSAAIPVAGMPLPPSPPPSARHAAAPGSPYAPTPEPIMPPPPPRASAAPPRPTPVAAPITSNPAAARASGNAGHGTAAPSPAFTGFRAGPPTSPSSDMASTRRSITAATLGGRCRYCSGTLPDGRQLTFCPHCGQDLTVQQCPACSTELELGWKFCTTCGRGVAQS